MKYKQLHPWNVSITEAAKIQKELSPAISLVNGFSAIRLIAGVDISVPHGSSIGRSAVAILSFPDFHMVEVQRVERELEFPYVPGFLSFRESPVILEAFERVENAPDVVIVDGQGIAHPRRFGIAAHLGLLLDKPTIGCAKSHLYGTYEEPGPERGDVAPLSGRNGEQIGSVVRTRTNTRPVFVSPGHQVSFESSVKIVLECCLKYRLPEPIRSAHGLAGRSMAEAV